MCLNRTPRRKQPASVASTMDADAIPQRRLPRDQHLQLKPLSSTNITFSTYHSIGKPISTPRAVPGTPIQERFRQHRAHHLPRSRPNRKQKAQFAFPLKHGNRNAVTTPRPRPHTTTCCIAASMFTRLISSKEFPQRIAIGEVQAVLVRRNAPMMGPTPMQVRFRASRRHDTCQRGHHKELQ